MIDNIGEAKMLDKTRAAVARGLYPIVEPRRADCIDGRAEKGRERNEGDALGEINRPGGDLGYLMVIFATLRRARGDFEYETALNALLDVIGGAQNFRFHTDVHHERYMDDPAAGCGHWAKACLHLKQYGLSETMIAWIKETLRRLCEEGARRAVLDGEHNEQAVVVVSARDMSARPQLDDGTQVFVYTKALDEARLKQIAECLASVFDLNRVPLERDLIEMSERQLALTISYLAPKHRTLIFDRLPPLHGVVPG